MSHLHRQRAAQLQIEADALAKEEADAADSKQAADDAAAAELARANAGDTSAPAQSRDEET